MMEEIDLLQLLRRIWCRRLLVVLVTAAALVVGIAVIVLSPVKYTASSLMVAQTANSVDRAAFGGLAAMAGVSVGSNNTDELSPENYPDIVRSVPFGRELIMAPVYFEELGGEIPLLDYFAGHADGPFERRETDGGGIEDPSAGEREAITKLSRALQLTYNSKNGNLQLSATMPEPLAAAQVAQHAQDLLQKYVTRFKVENVQATLDFVEERTEEARTEFERAQSELAAFRDRNQNLISATARIRGERLQNENDLAFSIYSTLMQQREQARIKVKETTPTITVIQPVTVPDGPSAPRKMKILAISLFLGFLCGCLLALVLSSRCRIPAQ